MTEPFTGTIQATQAYTDALYPPLVQGVLAHMMMEWDQAGQHEDTRELARVIHQHGEDAGLNLTEDDNLFLHAVPARGSANSTVKLIQVRNIVAQFERLRNEGANVDINLDLLDRLKTVLG